MSKEKEELKNISVTVSKECWIKLKILSVQKEISLPQLVREMLEKSVLGKKFENVEVT
jgi:hypothetical protein